MTASSRIDALLQLIRFDRPIGTLLLLWPALWALWIAAQGMPELKLLAIFIIGAFLMRSAGCIVNDLADRKLDGFVSRTQGRPLVTGAVSVTEAIIFLIALLLLAFLLVLMTNRLTVLLSIAAVVLASTYPFMKRVTHLPQIVLGAAFSWSIPMAFAAQSDTLPAALWLLYAANLLWTVAYDTQYAMVDREDDLKIGIKSTAILFGQQDKLIIGLLQGAALLCLFCAGQAFNLGVSFYIGLAVAAGLFVYHQILIRERKPENCFRAFLHNSWVGAVIFISIVLDSALSSL
jgi:4-hydroxybenzoate polyprenyltransferase